LGERWKGILKARPCQCKVGLYFFFELFLLFREDPYPEEKSIIPLCNASFNSTPANRRGADEIFRGKMMILINPRKTYPN
jgi:hypothetical protein